MIGRMTNLFKNDNDDSSTREPFAHNRKCSLIVVLFRKLCNHIEAFDLLWCND